MNCYQWSKKITGSVSVEISINETRENIKITGSGIISHGPLYTQWTRRELQCSRSPLSNQENWILRDSTDNLCRGRSIVYGLLTQQSTIDITLTPKEGAPYTFPSSIYFRYPVDPFEPENFSLLPLSPYPDWEDDPYSVATRSRIDNSTTDFLAVGLSALSDPTFRDPFYEVSFKWLKDGLEGESPNGFVSARLSVSFSLA